MYISVINHKYYRLYVKLTNFSNKMNISNAIFNEIYVGYILYILGVRFYPFILLYVYSGVFLHEYALDIYSELLTRAILICSNAFIISK